MNQDLQRGLASLEDGRHDEASAALARVDPRDPAYARAQNLLAQIELRARRLANALRIARRAVEAAPQEQDCRMTLSRVLEAMEDFGAARTESRSAIDCDPGRYDAWFLHATQALRMGDYGDAAEGYREAHRRDPGRMEALVNLGSALERMHDADGALAAYRKALQLAPGNPRVLLNVGRVEAGRDNFDAAVAAYREALEGDPEFADGWINLAVAFLRQKQPERAIEAVRRCLEVHPADRTATSLAMMAYQQIGDMDNYRRLYAFDELIYAAEPGVPEPYDSMQAFNTALAEAVLAHPTLINEPAGKSTRRGRQTGNLAGDDGHGIFGELQKLLLAHIERFLSRDLALPGHPYARFAPEDCELYMWATVLDEQGHQDPHIHPAGWVSGVYYVQVPGAAETSDEQAGWIEFGQPETRVPGIDESNTDLRRFPAREGHLFLFPSYFYHRTIPYRGDRPRISIAFDWVPKRLRRRGSAGAPAPRPELEREVAGLLRSGRANEARQACAVALERNPNDAVALAMMGQVMQQHGRPDRAMELFRKALAADSSNLVARLGLIGLARQSREHAEGLELAGEGIGLADDLSLRLARADLNLDLGRFEDARADLHAVLERAPHSARAAWLLALLGDDGLEAAALLKQLDGASGSQQAGLHFAAARLFERAGNIDSAIEHYVSANRDMHAKQGRHFRAIDTAMMRNVFTRELLDRAADERPAGVVPVFVVGLPRSGSTLIEQVLAMHSAVESIGETDLLWRAVAELSRQLPAGAGMPADIGRLPPGAAIGAGERYLGWIDRMTGADARVVVDRHLQNHAMLGMIELMLPQARIVYCRRREADLRWSCYRHWFDNVVPQAYDLDALAAAQREVSVLAGLWNDVLSLPRMTVDYETLVTEFEPTVRAILEFCGLAWEPGVLEYTQSSAPVVSGDRIGVRSAVYTHAVDRARPFMTFLESRGTT